MIVFVFDSKIVNSQLLCASRVPIECARDLESFIACSHARVLPCTCSFWFLDCVMILHFEKTVPKREIFGLRSTKRIWLKASRNAADLAVLQEH